jgi:hypothetical protein
MDADRFDALARSLTAPGSRRRALTGVVSGTLGLFGAWPEEAAAKTCKKIKNKKKRKKCIAKAKACVPSCAGKLCGDDGCGGSCGTCRGGSCQGGACLCPAGQEFCAGGLCRLPLHQACSGSDGECCPEHVCEETVVNDFRQLFCCTPNDASCANDAACCTTNCDADTDTCTTCRGRICDESNPTSCCARWPCENGFCGGCANRGQQCTFSTRPCCVGSCVGRIEGSTGNASCVNGVPCCDTDCTNGTCASEKDGPCVIDQDCHTCFFDFNPTSCDGACVSGTCTR